MAQWPSMRRHRNAATVVSSQPITHSVQPLRNILSGEIMKAICLWHKEGRKRPGGTAAIDDTKDEH